MEAQHLRIGSIRNQAGELQVLLMTDTRALDFERVFIPGLNEGTIPKKSAMESFIPFDIRSLQAMNLPVDAEASYAYVFYRLIQRASTLMLFSSTVDIQKRDQEASRYVRQIKTELLSENPDMKWNDVHFQLGLPVSPVLHMPPHNDWSKSRVEELIAGGLSASALNKFKECPLDYYFRYIAKVGEAEELDETISDAEMGTLAHTVLEDFYTGFINRYPSKDDFDEVIAQLDKWIDVAVSKSKRQMDLNVGNNALIRVTTKGMLERYFRFEQASLQTYPISREIIAVEQPFDFMADPTTGVRLRGKMDRVERLGNSIRILDYKTGKVVEADTELKMRTKANDLFDKQSSKMIQIMTYILAARHLYPRAESIDAGFISFRSIGKGWQMFESEIPFDQCEQGFKKFLNEIIQRMRQMGTWEHTHGARYCEYCESLGFDLESETAVKTEGDESTE
jgi:ATP-dependent helicase/DNAse subunit B